MADSIAPVSAEELADAIQAAAAPFDVVGRGSKRKLGRPVQSAATLDLSRFDGVALYEPEELILDAGAATRLADVEKLLDARGQQLAFEPPDLSALLGSKDSGSLGGVLCCNLAGPRRIKAGSCRDHVLGLSAVSGRGEIFKAGARVVKNVTGYDVPKLMAGSYGTLAAITSIIFKVLPKAETEETLLVKGLADDAAVNVLSTAMQSAADVSGAAHLPGEGTYIRIEGSPVSVAYRRDQLRQLLAHPVEVLSASPSAALWRRIRDVAPLADAPDRLLWRISTVPSEASDVMATISRNIDARYFYDWAGGLIWLDVPPTDDAGAALIRGALKSGHANLIRAPEAVRAAVDVFQPQPAALAALSSRVKASFDPMGLFNPGRMYRGH